MLLDVKKGMGIGSEAEIDIFLFWFQIKIIVDLLVENFKQWKGDGEDVDDY